MRPTKSCLKNVTMREKTRKTKVHPGGRVPGQGAGSRSKDGVLAILVDDRTGREYYVSILDTFTLAGQNYAVMYNYEPDDGSRKDPEIVIMRSWKDEDGEQVFSSITGKKELDRAFDTFFERYTESIIRS